VKELGIELPALSEAEWAERDAQAAANMRAHYAIVDKANARPDLARFGWPRRTLRRARDAMGTTSDPNRAIEQLLEHNFRRKNVAVLGGNKGVGKTVAAATWALRRPTATYFLPAAKFARASRYTAEQREEWLTAPALVLDDLGAEYIDTKGSFLTDIDELFDTFYADERPLIITTNCNHKTFQERYQERIWDRVIECAEWLSVDGPSLRGEDEDDDAEPST
jgi:DNA replication protein DnaC